MLDFAFDQAQARRAPLLAVFPAGAGPLAEEVLAQYRQRYPGVAVQVRAGWQVRPGGALLAAAEGAGLLVVGRPDAQPPTRGRPAPVGDVLLREAACPVAVIPTAAGDRRVPTTGRR